MLGSLKPCSRTAACSQRYLTLRLVSGRLLSSPSVVHSVLHPLFTRRVLPLAVFSDGFSEGVSKNLKDDFPSDEESYTDHYECLPDSDLDDEEGYTETSDPPSGNAAVNPDRKNGMAVPDWEPARTRRALSLAVAEMILNELLLQQITRTVILERPTYSWGRWQSSRM